MDIPIAEEARPPHPRLPPPPPPSNYDTTLVRMHPHITSMAKSHRSRTPSLSNSVATIGTSSVGTSSTKSSPTLSGPEHGRPGTSQSSHGRPGTSQSAHRKRRMYAMEQMSTFAPPQQSLPPSFITQFVRNCFAESLGEVDFTQAVKSMDYLKILDDRRKRELCAALRRLNIDTSTYDRQKSDLIAKLPALYEWVGSMEDKSRRAEALYTQVYIGLRRWALINEMRLMPFNKTNCNAMLNTLYPSTYTTPPTPQLTDLILNSQRNAFSRYIQAVEKHGRNVLQALENQSRRAGEINGWPVVRDILDKYLKQTNRVIDECISMKGLDSFERIVPRMARHEHSLSRASSSTTKRPILQHAHTYSNADTSDSILGSPTTNQPELKKQSSSTLTRLAREFRRIKSRTMDVRTDRTKDDSRVKYGRPVVDYSKRSLKPMASTSAMTAPGRETPLARPTNQHRQIKHSRANSADSPELAIGVAITGGLDYDAYRDHLIQQARREKNSLDEKRTLEFEEDSRVGLPSNVPFSDDKELYAPSPSSDYGDEDGKGKDKFPLYIDDEKILLSATVSPRVFDEESQYFNPYQPPSEELVIAELAG